MKYSLIPGLNSFMEDTEVNVEVAVDAPEAIEETEETADASAEIAETTEESEATDEQTEMIMHHFADLERRYNHVKQYGVDRTFMRLFNSNNELTRAVKYRFPSCESFNVTGNPYSRESIACMEGLGEILKAIWDFVVNLCKKIGAFFGRLFEAIRVRFGNLNDQIGRLRKLAQERTSWVDNIEDIDAATYSTPDIEEAWDKIAEVTKKKVEHGDFIIPRINDMKKWCDKLCADAKTLTVGKQLMEKRYADDQETLNRHLKESEKGLKNLREGFKDAKKDINRIIDGIDDNVYIKSMPDNECTHFLNLAAEFMQEIDEIQSQQNMAKTILKNVQTTAENIQRRRDEDTATSKFDRAYATQLAQSVNIMNQSVSFMLNISNRLASICVRAASKILQYRKKP